MLRAIVGILLLVWLLGVVFHFAVKFIHLIVFAAIVLFIIDLLSRRRAC